MNEDLLDRLIEKCNAYLYDHMYPQGLVNGSNQQRDLVRTFFAGVFEGFMVTTQVEAIKQLLPFYETMIGIDWYPDERFYFKQ